MVEASALEPPQVVTHAPALQLWPTEQATPQAPQLLESLLVFVHVAVAPEPALVHSFVPAGHEATQAPFAQTSEPGQMGAQLPDVQT